jgi:hypothetical protein
LSDPSVALAKEDAPNFTLKKARFWRERI